MAVTPGRKKRDNQRANQYFEPGVVGRKTGITIPQNARDEHGIEDLDGIFSSPEKAPPQKSAQNGNRTLTSEDMQLAQSSAPEPTEVLSTRRLTLKSSKTTFPPALGRSPYKTNIGSSPRRQSSVKPRRLASDTPELLEVRPTVTRRLDFTANGDVTSGSESMLSKAARRKSGASAKKDVYALEATEEEDEGRFTEEPDLPTLVDESLQLLQADGYGDVPALDEPFELPQTSSPSRQRRERASARQIETSNLEHEEEEAPIMTATKKKGKAPVRRSLADENATVARGKSAKKAAPRRGGKALLQSTKQQEAVEESVISLEDSIVEPSFEEQPVPRPAAKGRGKGRTRQLPTPEDTQPNADEPLETTELDDSVNEQPAKKRGRPGTKRKIPVHEDTEVDIPEVSEIAYPEEATELERPAKRAKPAPKKAAASKTSKAPKEKDPNIMPAPEFKKPNLPLKTGSGARWDESMWANSRNMSRLRDPTPSAEAMVGRTRSGRQVIKPLNHFANERAQYARDGTLLAVQTAETVEKQAPQRSQSRVASRATLAASSKRGVSRAGRPRMEETIIEEEEEEEEEDLEDWEARGEMIYGEVNGYDPLTGSQTNEQFETELAWGLNSVPLQPVNSANFGFAKLLSMPYFGSGIMDFPVGGFKKPRNSGKTSLHVFVHTGKVFVRVASANEFLVTKGGSFHVPRGNLYEIQNVADGPARLFFAQGTEMVVAE